MKKFFLLSAIISAVIVYGANFTGLVKSVPEKTLQIHQINIPKDIGDIYIIIAPDNTVSLLDTGVIAGRETVLMAALNKRGIRKIEQLILTHFHSDHVGGVITLLSDPEIRIGKIICSYPPENEVDPGEAAGLQQFRIMNMMAARKNIPVIQVNTGDTLNFGSGITAMVVGGATGKKYGIRSHNSQSLVFKLIYKDFTMLFTGDCGFEQEKLIFASGADIKSDVLKMAHHGGAGSNSEKFIDTVKPTVAIAPQPDWLATDPRGLRVENLLKERKIPYFRSWEYGDIILFTDGTNYGIARY